MRASRTLLRTTRAAAPRAGAMARMLHTSDKKDAVHAATTPGQSPQMPPTPFSNLFQHAQAAKKPSITVGPGQLNVVEQKYNPEFYEAVSKIMELRQQYLENRAIWVDSDQMIPLLKSLGAREEDMPGMQTLSDNLYSDPTLPFRKSRNGRFCIDFDTNSLRRLEFQPFALSEGEDFKRYDSGQIRRFDEIENELQLNSVCQALFIFKAMIIHGIEVTHREKLDYSWNKFICTLFSVRTITTPEILGEPALEGVHSDGVDHTMTTYLGSNNMAPNSAATFMHSMDEQTGIQLKEINPEHIMQRVQHKKFLDTLIIADHERKHSLSPVRPIDMTKEATRDMLIFFTRKPVEKDHISGSIDSQIPHEHLPMEIPLFIPGRQ